MLETYYLFIYFVKFSLVFQTILEMLRANMKRVFKGLAISTPIAIVGGPIETNKFCTFHFYFFQILFFYFCEVFLGNKHNRQA